MIAINLPGIPEPQASSVGRIVQSALRAADPRAAVFSALSDDLSQHKIDLDRARRVRVIAVGKAAQAMTRGLEDALGSRLTDGLIITKHPESNHSGRIRVLAGGHPVPDDNSVSSTRALLDFLSGGQPDEIVFCLISGGGSALMTLPAAGVSLSDLRELTRLLLACGAAIDEINTLRKHLDQVKGGQLTRYAAPARLITYILSDVIGSPLDAIASGPTVADPTTFADGLAVVKKYGLLDRLPDSIRRVLEEGARGLRAETPKAGDPALAGADHRLVSSNLIAAKPALLQAQKEGFNALLLTSYLQGEASQAGQFLAAVLKQTAETGQPAARPACFIAGGETTVTLRGSGLGGRNQEIALAAVPLLDGLPNVLLLAFGTDGEDGPTDAAGAWVTGETQARARAAGLDVTHFLADNDAYHFFEQLGQLVITGPTGTNVNDLAFLFAF